MRPCKRAGLGFKLASDLVNEHFEAGIAVDEWRRRIKERGTPSSQLNQSLTVLADMFHSIYRLYQTELVFGTVHWTSA